MARLVTISLILLLVLGAACSRQTRYKLLTTLFDDVPPLEGSRPPVPVQLKQPPPPRPSPARVARKPQPPIYFHPPYKEGRCSLCHDPQASNRLEIRSDKICFKCHSGIVEAVQGQKVHGPVGAGACIFCHNPHKSKFPRMLRKPVLATCFSCHKEQDIRAAEYHKGRDDLTCTLCHDPHRGEGRSMLKAMGEAVPAGTRY
ncbi:MAG: cytochrome c3 family protein [Thermodesulfobacteriota bacterium]